MSEVISVRVKKDVKKTLEESGVNVSKAVKEFLEELAWKVKVKESLESLDRLLQEMPPAPRGFASRSVREDRDRR